MKELMKAQREAARKKAQMQEKKSVADVYDTNIRTFSKSITGGKKNMAVKVGNSWVSEAALSYAKVKADSGESATLNGLLDRYPGVTSRQTRRLFRRKVRIIFRSHRLFWHRCRIIRTSGSSMRL